MEFCRLVVLLVSVQIFAGQPTNQCKDDPTGEVAKAGASCGLLKGMGCSFDLSTLNPAAPKGTLTWHVCPDSCDKCSAWLEMASSTSPTNQGAHSSTYTPFEFVVMVSNPTCDASLSRSMSTKIDDTRTCFDAGVSGTGLGNSLQVLSCSPTCMCFKQYGGDQNCDDSKALGTNIKQACVGQCLPDCNGDGCGLPGGERVENVDGIDRQTYLALRGSPRCKNMVSAEEYSCPTTGMIDENSDIQVLEAVASVDKAVVNSDKAMVSSDKINSKSKKNEMKNKFRAATGSTGSNQCARSLYTIQSAKNPGHCLDATNKRLVLSKCDDANAGQHFTMDAVGALMQVEGHSGCIAQTSPTTGPCETGIEVARNGSKHTFKLGGKCLNARSKRRVNLVKCHAKRSKQHWFVVPTFKSAAPTAVESGNFRVNSKDTNHKILKKKKIFGGFHMGKRLTRRQR